MLSYCPKCRENTKSTKINGRTIILSKCAICNTRHYNTFKYNSNIKRCFECNSIECNGIK